MSDNSLAFIDQSGKLTGINPGIVTVTYTVNNITENISVTMLVIVLAIPIDYHISGYPFLCQGEVNTFIGTSPGGIWSVDNSSIATVDNSGMVSGISPGTATITYTITNNNGCSSSASLPVTVNPTPAVSAINGASSICYGSFIQLSDAIPGGTWLSDNPNVGIDNLGKASYYLNINGTATITYSITDLNGCVGKSSQLIQLYSSPSISPILGFPGTQCVGVTAQLTNEIPGGVWNSSNPAVAQIDNFGMLTQVSAGNTLISYTVTNSNGCSSVASGPLTVYAQPIVSAITGPNTTIACASSTLQLSNATTGGAWGSSNSQVASINATGLVSPHAAGSTNITYQVINTNGCSQSVSQQITVHPLPAVPPITGATNTCLGSTLQLSNAMSGGIWSIVGFPVNASISSSGLVTPTALGSVIVQYQITYASGCTASVYTNFNVVASPTVAAITGANNVNIGSSIQLSDATTGGIWSSSNSAIATVNSTGLISGVTSGIATIFYSVTNASGCVATASYSVTVGQSAPTINTISPISGFVGSSVTITGNNFNTTAANNLVYFGTIKATVTSATATSISVKVPVGAAYQTISVTNTENHLTGYSLKYFDVRYSNTTGSAFVKRIEKATNSAPGNIISGDIDGDGIPDLVVLNVSTNSFSVFRNTSFVDSITLATKIDFAAGLTTVYVYMADLDGDGKPELLAVNYLSNSVSIYRNTSTVGNISFAPKIDLATGLGPVVVAAGDMDGDGKPDLAVTNNAGNTISIFINSSSPGTISFIQKPEVGSFSSPLALSIADLDSDGKPDLVVLNGLNILSIIKNTSTTGNVNFGLKQDFATGDTPNMISIGDMDGDGKLDLVVPNLNGSSLSIFKNTSTPGSVSLATKVDIACQQFPNTVGIGDFNGDGKPDIVVSYNNTVSFISIFNNKSVSGTVSFNFGLNYETATNPFYLTVSDIDGDGRADIALTSNSLSSLSVIKNIALPSAPIISSNTNANSFCEGGNTQLSSSVTIGNQWYKDGIAILGSVNQTVTVNEAGLYTDTITTRDGFKAGSSALAVFSNKLPQVTLNNNSSDCSGTAQLKLSAGTNSLAKIVWYRNDSIINTVMTDTLGTTVAGGNGMGSAANQLNNPVGVFLDGSNNVYVSDYFNHRIQKWAPGATSGITVAGGNGPGSAANQLYQPNGVFVDGDGNMYIADEANQRIQKWAPGATTGTTVADGNSTVVANQFIPDGVYLDASGAMYIVDVQFNRILKWLPGATTGITVAGGNGNGSAANQLNTPQGVFVDKDGNIFIADLFNRRIQKWAPGATEGITVAGGNGTGLVLSPNQSRGMGVFVDSAGYIYSADASRIQKWAPGAISGVTIAGGNLQGSAQNQLSSANSIFLDKNGNLYISDDGNHRIQKWARKLDTTYGSTIAGTYKAIATDYNGCSAVSNSITIQATPVAPVITEVGSLSFCSGDSVLLKSSTALSNQWYKDGTIIPEATDSFYLAKTEGIYTDSVTTIGGCRVGSDKVIVTVNPVVQATITPSGPLSFCEGGSVELTASAGNTYLWNTGETTQSIVVRQSGNYTVTVSNLNGCSTTSLVTAIQVIPLPEATITIKSSNNCTIRLNANTGVGLTYQWLQNDSTITGATAVNYSVRSNGTYSVTVSQNGCSNTSQSQMIIISDSIPPVVKTKDIIVSLNASGIATITSAQVNNGSTDNCTIASKSLDKNIFTCSDIGINTVTLTVTDAAGNSSSGTAIVTVQDNTKPVVRTQSVTVQLDETGRASITASQVDNGSTDNCSIATISVSPNSFTCENLGNNVVTLTVTDIYGNIATKTAVITVQDQIPPVVQTHNITVQLSEAGTVLITPEQIDNGSSDNCGIASMSVTPSSFNCSKVGANIVTLKVRDTKGNVSTGTALVTVEDNIAPQVITKNITVSLKKTGSVTITPAQVNNGSSDKCGIATMSLDKSTFTCADIGDNIVILTVTDDHGNSSSASAIVTVVGEIPVVSITSIPTSTIYTGGVSTNLYLGYGAKSTKLKVEAPAFGAPYTYQWTGTGELNSLTSGAPIFSPTAAGSYDFTVVATNKFGCSSTATISICVTDIQVSGVSGYIYICNSAQTLVVAKGAVDVYLASHPLARLGSCSQIPCNMAAISSVSNQKSLSIIPEKQKLKSIDDELKVTVMPNPSNSYFTLKIESNFTDPVSLRMFDGSGRLVDAKMKIAANSKIQVGHNYSSGIYFLEISQGNRRTVRQLIKVSR